MDSSNTAYLLIAGIYYIITGIIIFFSIFGVYILIRYGQTRLVSLTVSLLYGFFFLILLAQSFSTLQNLK